MTNEPVRENEPKTAPTAEKGPAESNAARTWRMLVGHLPFLMGMCDAEQKRMEGDQRCHVQRLSR